jgi:energy-coupling factor transporter ATP-binding protein EcfA2
MNIAFTGPSGSGKTTLAHYVAETYPELTFHSNSAYDVLDDGQREYLYKEFDYSGKGHLNVIRMSHNNPDFGLLFQQYLLHNRLIFLEKAENAIVDRCTVDNLAYFLDQVTPYFPEAITQKHLTDCHKGLSKLDIIFRIKATNPQVEDNASRVANWYYQQKIDRVFDLAVRLLGINPSFDIPTPGTPFLVEVTMWDLQVRKDLVDMVIGAIKNRDGERITKK